METTVPLRAIENLRAAVTYSGGEPPELDELIDDVRALLDLLTPGVLQLALERRRQVVDEGFDAEHDRGHSPQLFDAASEYALAASTAILEPARTAAAEVPFGWPWQAGFWKPDADPVKNARRAGAMLAAGIDALLAEQTDTKAVAE